MLRQAARKKKEDEERRVREAEERKERLEKVPWLSCVSVCSRTGVDS